MPRPKGRLYVPARWTRPAASPSHRRVVALDAESGQPLGAVTYVVLRVLRRVLVAQALGPGVVAEQRKPKAHLVLIRDLQGVVAAGGVGGFVGAVAAEVRVGNVVLGVGAGRQDLGVGVRVPQNIQVTALGGDISHLDRVVVRELILDGQVLRLYQRRLVVVLAGIEGKAQIVATDVLTSVARVAGRASNRCRCVRGRALQHGRTLEIKVR